MSSDETSLLSNDPGTLEDKKNTKEPGACLVIISGQPLGRLFPLHPGKCTVGRDPVCDIQLDDKFVSSKHGEFTLQQDRVVFKDLGSSNGSYIADQKITTAVLLDGEYIRVGKTVLKYLARGNAENKYVGKMFDMANIDALTQVFNKKYFLEELEKEFKRCRTLSGRFCLVMFDIDHFKKVNDTHGHPCGDYVLQHLCELLRDNVLRSRDLFARYGGEEFALILYDSGSEKACQVAERMRQTLESSTFLFEEKTIPVTISLGVAMYDHNLKDHMALISQADTALYESKRGGRNRVSFL